MRPPFLFHQSDLNTPLPLSIINHHKPCLIFNLTILSDASKHVVNNNFSTLKR